jgi:hypothetical protein
MSVARPEGVRRPRVLRLLGLGAVLAVLTSGCGADPQTTMRALASWTATVAMVGQAWADGVTPRAYTMRALERALRELDAHERELGQAPARLRTSATPITERVGRTTRRMAESVRAGDRGAVRTVAQALAIDAGRLQQLARREAGAP